MNGRSLGMVVALAVTAAVPAVAILAHSSALWPNAGNRSEYEAKEISPEDLGRYFSGDGNSTLPPWSIRAASLYDDHFTSPVATVEYENGIAIRISESEFDLGRSSRTTVIDGVEYPCREEGDRTDILVRKKRNYLISYRKSDLPDPSLIAEGIKRL